MKMESIEVTTGAGTVSAALAGSGPDLVVLHSLLTDKRSFQPVLSDLAAHHRVSLVDLPGFGSTSPVEPSIDAFADAIGGYLVAARCSGEETTVIGNGLGAFVALGTAIRHGDGLSRLVLVGCGLTFPVDAKPGFAAMIDKVERGGMAAILETAVRRIFPEEFLAEHPDVVAERREVLMQTDPGAFVTACRALMAVDYTDLVGAIDVPTLVVVGSRDLPTPPALAAKLAAAIEGAELLVMENVGHAPQLQDPARFLDVVAPFLRPEPVD